MLYSNEMNDVRRFVCSLCSEKIHVILDIGDTSTSPLPSVHSLFWKNYHLPLLVDGMKFSKVSGVNVFCTYAVHNRDLLFLDRRVSKFASESIIHPSPRHDTLYTTTITSPIECSDSDRIYDNTLIQKYMQCEVRAPPCTIH